MYICDMILPDISKPQGLKLGDWVICSFEEKLTTRSNIDIGMVNLISPSKIENKYEFTIGNRIFNTKVPYVFYKTFLPYEEKYLPLIKSFIRNNLELDVLLFQQFKNDVQYYFEKYDKLQNFKTYTNILINENKLEQIKI